MATFREVPHRAEVEQYLDIWRAERPTFLWAPTTPEGLLVDEITGAPPLERGVSVGYGGITNPVGGGTSALVGRSIALGVPTGLGQGLNVFGTVLVYIQDPSAVTGCFLKIGDSNGIGVGGGNTTFENTGSNLIALQEGVSWHVAPGTGFVQGLNIISFYAGWKTTDVKVFRFLNHTPGTGGGVEVLGSWIAATGQLGIGGYGDQGIRQTNAHVCAVAIWERAFDYAQVGSGSPADFEARLNSGGVYGSIAPNSFYAQIGQKSYSRFADAQGFFAPQSVQVPVAAAAAPQRTRIIEMPWDRFPHGDSPAIDRRWLERGLKNAYITIGPDWNVDRVGGGIGGFVVGGAGLLMDGVGKIYTNGIVGQGYEFIHGLDTGFPLSVVIGFEFQSGSVAWSLLANNTDNWTGWYGGDSSAIQVVNSDFGTAKSIPVRNKGVAFSAEADGVLRGTSELGYSVSATGTTPMVGVDRAVITLGWARRATNDNPAVASFTHIFTFQGTLTQEELSELALEPWRLFEPQRIAVPAVASEAPPPVTLARRRVVEAPWTQQPQEAVATSAFVAAWKPVLLINGGGPVAGYMEPISKEAVTTPYGIGISQTFSNADYQNLPRALPTTILAVCVLNAWPSTSQYPAIVASSSFGVNDRGGVELGVGGDLGGGAADQGRVYAVVRSNTYNENQTLVKVLTPVTVGRPFVAIHRFDTSVHDLTVYDLGESGPTYLGSGVLGTIAAPGANGVDQMTIGTANATPGVAVLAHARFDSFINDADVTQLAWDFTKWFEAQQIVVPVPGSGGGTTTPTLLSAIITGLTSLLARARLLFSR
jgi:hypothetical protein